MARYRVTGIKGNAPIKLKPAEIKKLRRIYLEWRSVICGGDPYFVDGLYAKRIRKEVLGDVQG